LAVILVDFYIKYLRLISRESLKSPPKEGSFLLNIIMDDDI